MTDRDIVERLKIRSGPCEIQGEWQGIVSSFRIIQDPICAEAAAAITALRSERDAANSTRDTTLAELSDAATEARALRSDNERLRAALERARPHVQIEVARSEQKRAQGWTVPAIADLSLIDAALERTPQ